jgi:hypothetical protein
MNIRKIESYLEIDKDGYIINPTSSKKFQEKWIPVIEEVKEEYLKHFGDNLVSVYIRGSVAKGEAIENISDVDSFALVSLKDENIDIAWAKEFNASVKNRYPYTAGVEIAAIPIDELSDRKADQIMIKTQSVCVYGKDLAKEIDPFKPGKDTAQHVRGIEREIDRTKKWLQDNHTNEDIRQRCTWLMKRILRSGFELVMERSQKYTRDLYPSYEEFAKYYPDKKEEMYEVLELAVNPTSNINKINKVLNGVGMWIVKEIKDIFNN